MTLKSRLRVTQGHWKRNQWIIIHDLVVVELFDVEYYCDLEMWAASLAISDIFSVEQWRDLENQVRGRSSSLKLAPFHRPHATFYWSAIVNIALSCTIFEFFDVE